MRFRVYILIPLVISSQAHAGWLQDIGKGIEEGVHAVGKGIEQGAQNLGKAAEDVVTVGEAGRRRDKLAAEEEQKQAKIRMEAAENLRQEKIRNAKYELVVTKHDITTLEQYRDTFLLLKDSIQTNLQIQRTLTKALSSHKMEFATYREVVDIQQKDLKRWVSRLEVSIKASPSSASAPSAQQKTLQEIRVGLQQKITSYMEQVRNIPQNTASGYDQKTIDDSLESGLEAFLAAKSNLESIGKTIDSKRERESQLTEMLKGFGQDPTK